MLQYIDFNWVKNKLDYCFIFKIIDYLYLKDFSLTIIVYILAGRYFCAIQHSFIITIKVILLITILYIPIPNNQYNNKCTEAVLKLQDIKDNFKQLIC